MLYVWRYEILMWVWFGMGGGKKEEKGLVIVKIERGLVSGLGVWFFVRGKVGN